MRRPAQSGQALLIAILLGVVLLVGITAVIFINQVGTTHQTGMSQRAQSQSIAEEGIAYAIQKFSISTTTWQNALQANFADTPCNTGSAVSGVTGGRFKLYCSTGMQSHSDLQPYEVAVTAVGMAQDKSGADIPLRAVQAYLAQRTLGVDSANGLHAHAALQLVRAPTGSGRLNVHWGPVVCLDSATWQVSDLMDTQLTPRKFSAGDIIGQLHPRSGGGGSTDLKEYWAKAPLSAPPLIDEESYQTAALNMDNIAPPKNGAGIPIPIPFPDCPPAHPQCGFFKPASGDKVIFDNSYSVLPRSVVYVKGSAEFKDIAIDNATFVITSTLTITSSAGGTPMPLHVPVTAPSEYPYAPGTPSAWTCSSLAGAMEGGQPAYNCDSASLFPSPGAVHFRGFLYVKGDLVLKTPQWNVVGALLVGDRLAPPGSGGKMTLENNNTLNLAYDDQINHGIQVSGAPLKIEPDIVKDIPAF